MTYYRSNNDGDIDLCDAALDHCTWRINACVMTKKQLGWTMEIEVERAAG